MEVEEIIIRKIRDASLLDHYLEKYHIRSFFDTRDLPFRLYEYAPGELMNVLHTMEQSIKYIVEGVFDHYLIQEDGSRYLIAHCTGFGFGGDLAFAAGSLRCIFRQVHAPAEKCPLNFIFCLRRKLCEAF